MASICNPTTKAKEKWQEQMSDIYDHWISKNKIVERFTSKYNNGSLDYNGELSAEGMKTFIEQRIKLPFDRDLPLSDSMIRRIKVEINSFDRALRGKFKNLIWIVPEGLSKQDPTSRKFYNKLNEILNHERVNNNMLTDKAAKIANLMTDAYIQHHQLGMVEGKRLGDQAIKKLQTIRKQMAKADPERNNANEFEAMMSDFIKSDKGLTIGQFIELVKLNKDDFKAAAKPGYKVDGVQKDYNTKVYKAAEQARELLDNMGGVYINGLKQLEKLVALKYTNSKDVKNAMQTNQHAKVLIEKLQSSVSDIEKSIKKGGYFPEMAFESILSIKEKLGKAMSANELQKNSSFSDMVDNVIAQINVTAPGHTKRRNPLLKKWWDVDPHLVLNEYSVQASQFNKLVHTQGAYLEALKEMPRTDMEFVKGLKRFIDEEYAVFTRGTSERPALVNKMVTTLNALQTARTMGLNITGGIKNAASAIHYYTRVGFHTIRDTRAALNDREFKSTMDRAEKEAGFLFKDAAQELYTEGLITKDQKNNADVKFNPVTGKITVDGKSLRNQLANARDMTISKLLFFHQMTENWQRKWMYRTSFHKKYKQLTENGHSEEKAFRFAKNYALENVNGWAYEYAAHAKAKPLRGEYRTVDQMENQSISRKLVHGTAGGMSELAFHMMHYPMSLMESQWSQLKGVAKSIMARQGIADSQELQWALRYAGVSTSIALASALLNVDLSNILEDETRERVSRVYRDVVDADNPDKATFGLLSEISGTNLGTLKYLAISQGIIDMDYNDLMPIIFGNVDYSNEADKDADLYAAYQYSTEWGVIKNKLYPALRDGRGIDVIRHTLKWYPNEFTKEAGKVLYGRTKKAKRPAALPGTAAAIKVLEGMLGD